MNRFFRSLPLTVKLMLIGLIPLVFVIYISFELYREKTRKLNLLHGYIERVHQSADITKLINELQRERRFSFEYALKKDMQAELVAQRPRTDSAIDRLVTSYPESLSRFTEYTFLADLRHMRDRVDTGGTDANAVMHYYTTAVFRLNTLNSISTGSNSYLAPVYKDLESQKILSDMVTLLSILRTNIYNVLYTRKYMVETLIGSLGTYDIYKSYETEFFQKGSPASIADYNKSRNSYPFRETIEYIDKLFTTFKFDSTYNDKQWWTLSTAGATTLWNQQDGLLHKVETKISVIYQHEKAARSRALIYIILALVFVFGLATYTIHIITRMLLELKRAAQQISRGAAGFNIQAGSNDVIGSLAASILQIDRNNKILADAAEAIGKGDFDVTVKPRSKDDVLGNAIIQMKNNLKKATDEMREHEQRKNNFITMASHELKTPITSIKGYVQLLLTMLDDIDSSNRQLNPSQLRPYLVTVDNQVIKLTRLISELLDLSRIENGKFEFHKDQFHLNELVAETVKDIQHTADKRPLHIHNELDCRVYGDRDRIGQVLLNLLTNAIKYSPGGEKIDIHIYQKDNNVAVSVRDSGIGIDKKDQQKIFERFYRVEGKNEQTFPGFGIGLFIANEIIHRHHGSLGVESVKGEGAVFVFTLPLSTNGQ